MKQVGMGHVSMIVAQEGRSLHASKAMPAYAALL